MVDLLSRRQKDAAGCVLEGLNTKETALVLGVKPRTAKDYIEAGMSKLGAINRAHYVALLFHHNVFRPEQVGHHPVWKGLSSILVGLTFAAAAMTAADDAVRPRVPRRPNHIVRLAKMTRFEQGVPA